MTTTESSTLPLLPPSPVVIGKAAAITTTVDTKTLQTTEDVAQQASRLSGLRSLFRRLFPEKVKADFTVVIATYNGATRLGKVLDCLRCQVDTSSIDWEVIVVDNNSTDDTAQVVRQYQTTWPSNIPLRYEFEPQQGAGYARQLGTKAANSPLIGYLDDDNLPWLNWVRSAYKFAQRHPNVGVYGSRIRGKFATSPPAHFERIAALLALTDRGSQPIPYQPAAKVLPPGAGLVVRRQAWLNNVPEERTLADKFGEREAGEDLEVVLRIQQAGWAVWYNAAMWMHHEIPESRLTKAYLVKLCRGIGLSRYHTRMLSWSPWQRPLVLLPYAANDMRKIVQHVVRYRHQVITDTVTASEMMLYLASLVSPLHSWYRLLKKKLRPSA
ncbi:MAG: hormogonium polysaccharide biosynthesis glycosyltransferase HpsE [Cyanobacteria bacterium J06634_6]